VTANQAGNALPADQAEIGDVLVAAIPTEALALYTAAIAAIAGGVAATDRHGLRWAAYAFGFFAIFAYLVQSFRRSVPGPKRKRQFPGRELLAAWVAFAAWGLVMPGSGLMASLDSANQTLWAVLVTVIGVALLWLVGSPLKDPVPAPAEGGDPPAA
jgi:bacteriorhodopsin